LLLSAFSDSKVGMFMYKFSQFRITVNPANALGAALHRTSVW